jgi:hypothetical protein
MIQHDIAVGLGVAFNGDGCGSPSCGTTWVATYNISSCALSVRLHAALWVWWCVQSWDGCCMLLWGGGISAVRDAPVTLSAA